MSAGGAVGGRLALVGGGGTDLWVRERGPSCPAHGGSVDGRGYAAAGSAGAGASGVRGIGNDGALARNPERASRVQIPVGGA